MNQSTISYVVLGIAVLISALIIFPRNNETSANANQIKPQAITIQKVEGGETQILDLTARGGYQPNIIEAKANVNTILRVKTLNTFDCSAAFTIPQYQISQILPSNGTTDFDIGAHKPGETVDGSCSMGMYGFTINFK